MEVPEKLVEMMASGRPLNQITSLSLSGQFKSLTTLGNSLSRCTSLTSLDLSRNALTTLDGLQSLPRAHEAQLLLQRDLQPRRAAAAAPTRR